MSNYIQKHKGEWQELENLIQLARRSPTKMQPEQLSRLDVLYRQTTTHLAQVSSRTRDAALAAYLNDLTAAAHSLIYLPPRANLSASAWIFVRDGFARAVARTWRLHATAVILIFMGFLLGYIAVEQDPVAAYAIMPGMESRLPGSTREQLLEALRHGRGMGSGEKFAFSSFLFSHNLTVGFLTLATGILAAIPSIILLLYNGMILGAFSAIHHNAGIYSEYWAWVLPHGISEMGAIALCGGVGLQLGTAIVCPGLYSRDESLRRAGKEAGRVILGVGFMLAVAAVAESYLRQSHLPMLSRFGFAAGTLAFWSAYFFRGALLERAAIRNGLQSSTL